MDYRTHGSKSVPPYGLPTDFEEEIRLPKFVEQVPERPIRAGKEKKLEHKLYSEPKKKNNYIPLIIIAGILLLAYFGYSFWKKEGLGSIFSKKTEKEEITEAATFETQDEDGDELTNLQEMQYGTNTKEKDTDFDGMPDGWEVKFRLNPLDYSDALADPDEDGLTNLEEYQYNSDPTKKDTDSDGYPDGSEVEHGFNPAGTGKLVPK